MVGSRVVSDLNRLLVIGTEACVADYLVQGRPAGVVRGSATEGSAWGYGAFGAESIRVMALEH
jgi:hypothetical protein